ncbi:MAG: hypothetical protein IIX96_00985, partial [Clostridia bacterium]|nr:hypothetical protein [Clostridia bacterium]
MKKRFISTGLLKNSISRIFVLTLIFTVGETAIAALMSFTFALGTGEGSRMLYDFYTMNPLASGLMIFAVPILTVNEFSYLTNRAGADFFDALPHTRTSVAVCGIGAVAISVLARLTVSTLTSVVMTLALCHKTIAISFSSVIVPYLSVLTASLLLAVICALACSITGTTANALMVTFLIAAGPRIVMSLTNFAISGNLPVLMSGKVLPLFDNSYNLLTMLVGSLGAPTVTLKAFIYTLILTSVYLFLAIFAYNKRKSEYASRSAPGKLANHIYRISLASFISICAITLAFSIGFDLVVVVLFVISLIVYFAYELIANKSVRGLPAAAAWLPVFVAVNLLFAAVIGLGSAAFKAYSPDAEKIKYVSVVTDGSSNYVDLPEYAFLVAQDARLEDGNVKKIISSSLEENLEELEKGTYYI